jgi:hypothetical protein
VASSSTAKKKPSSPLWRSCHWPSFFSHPDSGSTVGDSDDSEVGTVVGKRVDGAEARVSQDLGSRLVEEHFRQAQSAGRGDQLLKRLTANVVNAKLRFVNEKTGCVRRVEAFTYGC